MAKSKTLFMSILFIALTLLFSAEADDYYQDISPNSLGLQKEQLTHLHFYFHDTVTGPKPTAVHIAQANTTNTSPTMFGLLSMADDPLTVGPTPDSKLVGRAQGLYGSAAQGEVGLLMVLNLAFTEGKYNGSTFSLLGRNKILSPVREFAIVGGTGDFRFARGYAQAKTYTFDLKTGNAVVEYNAYVLHY